MTAILSATRSGLLTTFVVCPDTAAGQSCRCIPDAEGQFPAHQTFTFGAKPDGDARTDDQWAAACAREALLLVEATKPVAPVALPGLVTAAPALAP